MKDLVELVFIAAVEKIEAPRLGKSVEATFGARGMHPIADRLPEAPTSWAKEPWWLKPQATPAKSAFADYDLPDQPAKAGFALPARDFQSPGIGERISPADIRKGYELAAFYWDPFLSGGIARQTWFPEEQRWRRSAEA